MSLKFQFFKNQFTSIWINLASQLVFFHAQIFCNILILEGPRCEISGWFFLTPQDMVRSYCVVTHLHMPRFIFFWVRWTSPPAWALQVLPFLPNCRLCSRSFPMLPRIPEVGTWMCYCITSPNLLLKPVSPSPVPHFIRLYIWQGTARSLCVW